MNEEYFSNLSIEITKSLTKKEKKDDGIFFTPMPIRKLMFKGIEKHIKRHNKVKNRKKKLTLLEPSCGSAEFIDDALIEIQNIIVTGIEKNEKIYNKIKNKYDNNNNVSLINDDFLTYDFGKQYYNYILGNPPYFLINKLMREKYDIDKDIHRGKINIFCLFIDKCLKLLKNGGILSFVIPTTILNVYAYNLLRKYIEKNFKIMDIIQIKEDDFLETKQATLILTLKKHKRFNNNKFIFNRNDFTYFVCQKEKKKYINFFKNTQCINDIDNVIVKTGNIVWNQCKDNLTTDNKKDLLIYDYNVTQTNELKIYDEEGEYNKKGQYIEIKNKKKFKGPAILIVRGHGNGNFKIRCVFLSNDFGDFYAENHIYVILSTNVTILEQIYNSLTNLKNIEFLEKLIPNKCLTKKDIEFLIPMKKK
jgi:tRNA1(Val) A37 N6-methylase TrmN6|tara:strand:+ start:4618 stop:5874 length:1257 start_codon:yes stop_codon:yes gene_type:complete